MKFPARMVLQVVGAAAAALALSELALAQVVITSTDALVQASGFITNNLGQSVNNSRGGPTSGFASLNQSFTNPLALPAGQHSTSGATQTATVSGAGIMGTAAVDTSIVNAPGALVLGVAQGISQLSVGFTVPGVRAVRVSFVDGFAGGLNAGSFVQITNAAGDLYFDSDAVGVAGNFTGGRVTLPPGDYTLVAATSAITDITFANGVAASAQWHFDLRFSTLPPCRVDLDGNYVVNSDDLGDYILDYFREPPVPGPGLFAQPCPGNPPPYDAGYRMNYTVDGSPQCHPPYSDNLGDFILDYFNGCDGY